LIQIQQKDDIFSIDQSQVLIFRADTGDSVSFNLFPIPGKESQVSSLDELRIFIKKVPNKAASASKSNIKKSTTSPISLQVESKKKDAVESQTLGSLSVLKPNLKNLKFYIPGSTLGLTILGLQEAPGHFILSESLLSFAQDDSSITQPGYLVARIARDQLTKRAIPVVVKLDTFVAENQQIIIQIVGLKGQKIVSTQVASVPRPFVVGQNQLSQKIKTLNFTRIDRGRIKFSAYLENIQKIASVDFSYRTWSESEKHRASPVQSTVTVDSASRSASITVICTEKEYVEVYATAVDESGRVCGQPVRTLVTPAYKREDLSAVVLRKQDLSGITAEAVGLPDRTTRIKVVRRNLDTKIEDLLGFFTADQGSAVFTDPTIVEQFFPNFSNRFSYEVYIERDGSLQRSSHELLVDFNLINDSYVFEPEFSQKGSTLSVRMVRKDQGSTLDVVTKDLSTKSLTDAYADEIKQIRSQTAEKILYDVYSVSEIDGEQTYVGEFSEDQFSITIENSQSIFVLPKTATPRQQISAIKKLSSQPQLVSKSRVSRVSARSLAPNLDTGIVVEDGVKSKIYTQRSLIDGIISTSESAKTFNLTGHVFCYSSSKIAKQFPGFSNVQAKRVLGQKNVISWAYPTSTSFSYFSVSAQIGNGTVSQICKVPLQSKSSRYQFIDPVFGRVPGKIVYSIAPIDFDGTAGPAQSIVLDLEEVQIG